MARVRGATDRAGVTAGGAPVARAGRTPEGPAFATHLRSARGDRARAQLDILLAGVDAAAARLVEERTLANLKAYREAVRAFLVAAQEAAVTVQNEVEWDYREWQHRTVTVVRRVDAALEELAHEVMAREQDRLKLLERIGEIKGLLLDLRI